MCDSMEGGLVLNAFRKDSVAPASAMLASKSGKSNCYVNAVTKRFFATLE